MPEVGPVPLLVMLIVQVPVWPWVKLLPEWFLVTVKTGTAGDVFVREKLAPVAAPEAAVTV